MDLVYEEYNVDPKAITSAEFQDAINNTMVLNQAQILNVVKRLFNDPSAKLPKVVAGKDNEGISAQQAKVNHLAISKKK